MNHAAFRAIGGDGHVRERDAETEFTLGALRDGRLRVVEPIAVTWTTEDGQCVAEAAEINEFGFGDNLTDAIADLQAAIAELHFTLDADQERLGPDLQAVRATLTRKIRRADVPCPRVSSTRPSQAQARDGDGEGGGQLTTGDSHRT